MITRMFTSVLVPVALCSLALTSCGLIDWEDLIEEEEPTKSLMEGVWQVTEAYNERGEDILDSIDFPITGFHLSDDNAVTSTAGPMIMYIVYGGGGYTKIASKVDQVFKYADLNLTNGDWFIDKGVVDRFTIEMRLKGVPGQTSLKTLLDLLQIKNEILDLTIYHKFMDVKVTFDDDNNSMTWEFDETTTARYNTVDKYGEKVLWDGISVNEFSHATFVLTKKVKDLEDLVTDAKN